MINSALFILSLSHSELLNAQEESGAVVEQSETDR